MANNKSSGKDLVKVVIIVIALVVLVACSFFSIINGIVEIFKQKAQEAIGAIAGAAHKGLQWLGTAKVSKGLPTFIVDKAQVEALKTNLESQAIDTDVSGMTEIRLSKMLLAYAVSSSFNDTVCAVEITEEDIINNFKEKNKEYKNDTSVTIDTVLDKYENMESSSKWNISSINYTLYNTDDTSKVFFYFKDEDKVFGDNEEAWFLGAMGATTISTADGENLNYIGESGFTEIKANFDAVGIGDKLNSKAYQQMLSSYTKTDSDTIKMYTVDVQQKEYYFCFENNLSGKIEEPEQTGEKFEYDVDADSTYDIGIQEINLTESIDLSKYSIPIELMMDLLNITGSGEFLETFIDYALSQISASVTAYSLSTESKTYEQKKYNVDSNFVIELYDLDDFNGIESVADGYKFGNTVYSDILMTNVVRSGAYGDNFLAYYDIIYNRKYNGTNIPNNRVTSIENYKDIRYKDEENYNYENPNKDECKADSLEKYLKTAYEPGGSLREINITEVICKTSSQNKWQLMVSSINTWYGDFSYILSEPEVLYTTPDKLDTATQEDYENYNHTNMKEFEDETGEEKEIRYIWEDILNQVNDSYIQKNLANVQDGDDIYDNAMKTGNGQDNREHFQNWTMRGLATIAQNDGGEKSAEIGAGKGTDYIYCKYKKVNVKNAKAIKTARQIINENNIQMTSSNDDIEAKMRQFLALLRNTDGKIPNPLNSGTFTARDEDPSIVVRYADIYEGTIPAGDLLLDNGALMLFELLETSENTQGLVNVFKYLAYLYTGTDYGITTATELATLFNTYQYSGTNYIVHTTLSDKDIVLDENKLKEAISKTYKGEAQTNLLNCIKQFMAIQETQKVNAVFAIAVTTIESSNGTNWDAINPSTYNWFSIKGNYKGQSDGEWRKYPNFGTAVEDFGNLINGSNYFKAGKTTVNDIGPIYCNEQWAEDVNLEMTKIYNSIGIYSNTGGIEGNQGDITTFTVGNRTYKNYKQIIDSYKSITLAGYPKCNLYSSGCAITSDAIIASGFNSNDTPVDVNNYAKTTSKPLDHPSIVKHYTGKKATWIYNGDLKTEVINQLRNGLPVMVHASSGKFAANGSHFFVILSVSEDETKVYVSNPSSYKDGISTGWLNASDLNTIDRYLKME